MASSNGMGPPGALPRPHFEPRRYLTASDLRAEQDYRLQRIRRHSRFLHGWGVVCGLRVVPAGEVGYPWALRICPGYAIRPYGDEIEVSAPGRVDLREFLWHQPASGAKRLVWVGVRAEDVARRPVPTSPPGCGCPDPRYAASRLGDGYRAEARWGVTQLVSEFVDLCEPAVRLCATCPDSPWVWLARVLLPVSESDPLTPLHIDNSSQRRRLVATAGIQTQLVRCCCDGPADASG
jgi:hypothetical protein